MGNWPSAGNHWRNMALARLARTVIGDHRGGFRGVSAYKHKLVMPGMGGLLPRHGRLDCTEGACLGTGKDGRTRCDRDDVAVLAAICAGPDRVAEARR